MKKPLVSIGIPTYNRADSFLSETLQSALDQKYRNIEIIVSDNCSTDNTGEVVSSFNDERIRYFRQNENIGPFRNMNYCLENARGDYFLMLHDDDLIDPDFIEICMERINYRDDAGIIIAGSREIDEQGNILREKQNLCNGIPAYDFLLTFYEKKVHLLQCSILFNTKKMMDLGGFNEFYGHFADAAIEFTMICKTERVDVPDVLASYCVHSASFGKRSKILSICDNALKILDLACRLTGAEEKNNRLRTIGMLTTAERLYRYATYRTKGIRDRIHAHFTVWKKLNYRYYPPKEYLDDWVPLLRYIQSPNKIAYRLYKKITMVHNRSGINREMK